MRSGRTVLHALLLTSVVALTRSCCAGDTPSHELLPWLRVPATSSTVTLDGVLDEPCWRGAAQTGAFTTMSGGAASLRTVARIAHDGARLLIAVVCSDPTPDKLRRECSRPDGEVWTDDCVEVFVDSDLDLSTYYHFIVNASNVRRDEVCDIRKYPPYDASWDSTWEAGVNIGAGGWTAEIAVPLAELGVNVERDVPIGLNLCRSSTTGGGQQCWVATGAGFHNPRRNAVLVLRSQSPLPAVSFELSSPGSLTEGDPSALTGVLRNNGSAAVALDCQFLSSASHGSERYVCDAGTVAGGGSANREFPYRLEGTGEANLLLIVRQRESGAIASVADVVASLPLMSARAGGARLPSPGWGSAWYTSGTWKVRPDQPGPTREGKSVTVSAAANEYECFQLVLRPHKPLTGVLVTLGRLKGDRGTLPASAAKLFRVDYVPVVRPTDAFGSPGLWPDPLVPIDGTIDLPDDRNTSLWVRLYAPKGSQGGTYSGSLTVRPTGEQPLEVPVELRVYDFQLTDETHTPTAYGLSPAWSFLGITDRRQQEEVFEQYLGAFREHRLACYDPFAFHPMKYDMKGPEHRAKVGDLELVCDRFQGRYFRIYDKGELVADLSNTITEFEKEGVGWQGSGLGWPGINRIRDVKVVERTANLCVLDVTGEHTPGGPANRAYEITFRFRITGSGRGFVGRLVRFKNTDTVGYQLQGYYWIVSPASENAQRVNGSDNAAWIGAKSKIVGETSTDVGVDYVGQPTYVQNRVWIEPGQEVEGFGPAIGFFVGEGSDQLAAERLAAESRAAMAGSDARVGVVQYSSRDDATVVHGFADFDRAAEKYLEVWHLTGFSFPAMPSDIAGHPRFSPEYERLHKLIYGPMVEHLRQKGWLSKAYSYWYDEPTEQDYPYVVQGMDLLRRNCPGLTRLLTEQVEDPLIGHVDLWVPVLSAYNEQRCKERQAAGDSVWWYVCCGPGAPFANDFIDHPAVNHRLRYWMMEKYGVTGDLYWSTTHWYGKDMAFRSPWLTAESKSPDGGDWGCGDGVLLYPACREPSVVPVLGGPVITQRIECIRDGLEDLEYFWTLKQLIARSERKVADGTAGPGLREALEAARTALQAPDRLIGSLTEYSLDADQLVAERDGLAKAIEGLSNAM